MHGTLECSHVLQVTDSWIAAMADVLQCHSLFHKEWHKSNYFEFKIINIKMWFDM